MGDDNSKSYNPTFQVTTYKGKRYCAYCGNYMWGLIEQGLQCGDCGINAHKTCARLVPHDCTPNPKLVQRLFGASLVTLVKLYGTQRPVIVNLCIQELERRDVLKLRGIYPILKLLTKPISLERSREKLRNWPNR